MADQLDTLIRESRKRLGNPYALLNDRGRFEAILLDAGQLDTPIRESRKRLGNRFAYLNDKGEFEAILLDTKQTVYEGLRGSQNPYAFAPENDNFSESRSADQPTHVRPVIDATSIFRKQSKGKRLSRRDIETVARNFQLEMWKRRSELFPERTFQSPLDILKPPLALDAIGYQYDLVASIGQHSYDGDRFEVAGLIDPTCKTVQVSRQFGSAICNFTAAHELGHAILHGELGLHRDRPLDGSTGGRSRDRTELEADTFATYFLMPSKQVQITFQQTFQTDRFVLNEETAFALDASDYDSIRARCRTVRDLSRILADARQYNGTFIYSLSEIYGVSIEAMAIRLEELQLVRV